jgi:hypothetical protein
MTYDIFLDDIKIGTSPLDKADAPMGVVFGHITFTEKPLTFDFFSKYCKDHGIKTEEDAEHKFISTQTIPNLKVINKKGIEIKGVGCYIEGLGSDPMDIYIIGIPYPFYEEEFPHHRKAYNDQFG